jgi:protein tyrosine phosphatase (PTP) superfamily phosphohydrolase (DUF442 family)
MTLQAGPESITNWHRLDSRITTSGQPNEHQLAILQALGVRHVINLALHTHEQALADEAASVAALGPQYTHIPVDFQNPTEQDFTRFCAAFAATEPDKVHVHCIMNYRVSAFLYRYRRAILGLTDAQARPDLEKLWQPQGVWAEFIKAKAG